MASPAEFSASAEERRSFRRDTSEQVVVRLRWGLWVAAGLCAALLVVGGSSHPEAGVAVPILVAVAAIAAAFAATYIPPLRRRPTFILFPLSFVIAASAAVAARATGGFASPFYYVVLLIWIFGAAVLPLSPVEFIVNTGHSFVAMVVIIAAGGRGGSWALPVVLSAGALAFCLLGAVLRDRGALRSFVVSRRLDEANRRLADNQRALLALNVCLEERVKEQVDEIVQRAGETDALNTQLRQKVVERSAELAHALQRLSRAGRHAREVLAPGTVFAGRIEIVRRIGEGGMGTVYLGRDRLTRRPVALKLMHPDVVDPATLQRFVVEAAAAAAVTHPGVIQTLHIDVTEDGRLYQLMEHVEGVSLDRGLMQERLSPGSCARIGAEVGRALAAAHAAHVIHRDIKPSNILLTATRPGVRVLDFGVSKVPPATGWDEATGLTERYELLGTPEFMSPEQVRDAAAVTPATDVYSLGVVLYLMLSGRLPFEEKSAAGLATAHLGREPVDLSLIAPGVPGDLRDLVLRCLAKDAAARPTAAALADTLSATADRLQAPSAEAVALEVGKVFLVRTARGSG